MHQDLHYQLYEFAQRAREQEFPERLAHIFVTSLARGQSQSRKERLYRDIICRLAAEIELDIDLATTKLCECGCGEAIEIVSGPGREKKYFNSTCRKRAQRARNGMGY